jgi:hypothetical protein
MATPNNEQVRYDILIEAKQAIKNLREIMKTTEDNTTKMHLFNALVLDSAEKWKKSWQQSLNIYKQLNAEMTKQKKGSLFGQTGGKDIPEMSRSYLQAADNANRLGFATSQASKEARKLGDEVESAGQKGGRGIDVMRIAMGVFVSELIFKAQQVVSEFFTEAIKQATQLEETMYRLANDERVLSKAGQDVSLAGLEEGITRIQNLLPIFSREDISQLVGQIAIGTQQLGYTEEQILQLTETVALLNIQSVKQEDLLTTASHVMSAVLGKSSQGIAQLGVSFNETEKQAAALDLQLLNNGRTLQDLTDNELAAVKLRILHKAANVEDAESLEMLNRFLESNSAKISENKAAWQDFLATVGQGFANLIPDVSGPIKWMQEQLEVGKIRGLFQEKQGKGFLGLSYSLEDQEVINKLFLGIKLTTKEYEHLKEVLSTFSQDELLKIFPNPDAIENRFARELIKSLIQVEDTATNTQAALEDLTKFEGAEEFGQKLQEIADDFEQALEDLDTKRDQKLDDLDTEYLRKQEDAQVDYLRKIADINRDYERDLANLKEKHRREDEDAEAKYQLALWELRMRFLMNLEDALHARDARQVLRLQKQYALDKEALQRKHALEEKEREESQASEQKELEERRNERLEDARIEYEQKLADLRLAKERELADLNVWYERELADLKLAMERKAQALIDAGIREKQITEENAKAVYDVLLKYFGPGGLTDQLNQYMMNSLTAAAAGSINALLGLANNVNPFTSGMYVPAPKGSLNNNQGLPKGANPFTDMNFAEGGSLLATRPTTATFGEAGPELVNFTPLSRIGKNIHKIFGDLNGGGGVNGQIRVVVDLSPDLEGRIVEKSMDGVADVMARVGRSK